MGLKERTTSQSMNNKYQTSRKCERVRFVLIAYQIQISPTYISTYFILYTYFELNLVSYK